MVRYLILSVARLPTPLIFRYPLPLKYCFVHFDHVLRCGTGGGGISLVNIVFSDFSRYVSHDSHDQPAFFYRFCRHNWHYFPEPEHGKFSFFMKILHDTIFERKKIWQVIFVLLFYLGCSNSWKDAFFLSKLWHACNRCVQILYHNA